MSGSEPLDAGVLSTAVCDEPSQAILDATRQIVTTDPIGGTIVLDTAALVVSSPTFAGQVTPEDFIRRLGDAIVTRQFPSSSSISDGDRAALALTLGNAGVTMLGELSTDPSINWQTVLERALGPVDRRTGDTVKTVIDRLVNQLDDKAYLAFLSALTTAMAQDDSDDYVMEDPDAELAALPPAIVGLAQTVPIYIAAINEAKKIEKDGPINGLAPSLADGNLVHRAIQIDYVLKHPDAFIMVERNIYSATRKIGTLSKLAKSSGNNTRALLVLANAFVTLAPSRFLAL